MRWDQLFADLEAQLEAEEARDLMLEVADRIRRERAQVALPERLLAHRCAPVTVSLRGGLVVGGDVQDVGLDWLLVQESVGRPALVPLAAVLAVSGLTAAVSSGADARMARRFGFGYALRGVSRDRAGSDEEIDHWLHVAAEQLRLGQQLVAHDDFIGLEIPGPRLRKRELDDRQAEIL